LSIKAVGDYPVEDYVARYGIITYAQREKMVRLILDLHKEK